MLMDNNNKAPVAHICVLATVCVVVVIALVSYSSKVAFWEAELETARARQTAWCSSKEAMEAQKTHDRCAKISEDLKLSSSSFAVREITATVLASPFSFLAYLGNNLLAMLALVLLGMAVAFLQKPAEWLQGVISSHTGPIIATARKNN
jgi:ABC-type uncharacterized transport system permease subunit